MSNAIRLTLVGVICFVLGATATPRLPFALAAETPKGPRWLHGLDLKCRKGGQSDFSKANKIGVEVYRDENTGNLIYISETGSIAVVSGK